MLPISVITVSHNSESVIGDFLESVGSTNVEEIIVVDCGSTDNTNTTVASNPNVKLVKIGNEGYGRGNNAGVAVAKTEMLLILNPDVRVSATAVERLYEFCSKRAVPGIVAPKMFHFSNEQKIYRKDSKFEGTYQSVEKVCGAAMMMSKDLFEKLNGFDPNIFLYFEETDLCFRAANLGAEVLVYGEAEVEHFKSGSTPSDLKYEFIRGWHDGWSKLYYVNKCASSKWEQKWLTLKTLIQTYVKILTKRLSGNEGGHRRELNKLKGMKAFRRGEKAFTPEGVARFTE